jgi:hypothetical protein
MESPRQFVLRPLAEQASQREVSDRLRDLGEVRPIPTRALADSPGLLLFVPNEAAGDDSQVWSALKERLAGRFSVAPVIEDGSGGRFPSGEVIVRFAEAPSNEALQDFADQHSLRVQDRNRFVREQVKFTPAAAAYLPDLVTELQKTPEVKQAWCDLASQYRRS